MGIRRAAQGASGGGMEWGASTVNRWRSPGPSHRRGLRSLVLWVTLLALALLWALCARPPAPQAPGSAAGASEVRREVRSAVGNVISNESLILRASQTDLVAATTSPPLPYFLSSDLTPAWPSAADLQAHPPLFPDFNLLDQAGRRVNKSTLAGKVVVANFFFTQCSSICPKLTSAMAQVRDAQRGQTGLLLLSHSVTPEWDTPPVLMAYAQANHIDGQQWRLLTGSKEQINQVAHQGYFVPRTAVADDGFIHTELLVLLDTQQRIRGVYNGSQRGEINQLLADVALLLLGADGGSNR
jgi:protein SCO1